MENIVTAHQPLAMSSEIKLSRRAKLAAGQPISELMSRALSNPNLISLAAGFVDQPTLPAEPTKTALEAIFNDHEEALSSLQYGTTPGFPSLREIILADIIDQDGIDANRIDLDQIVVTAGSNQLLHLVVDSLLDPGDIVLCASPTYLVFLGILQNVGARSIGVANDENGMVPESLQETLEWIEQTGDLPRVKAIYLVPYYDNPCGITMPLERRAAIVEIAKRWSHRGKIHVIADAAYRELRYEGEDVPSTRACDEEGDTVIVAGTFSKSYSPGIRVGWGVLPKHLVPPVCDQKGNIDFGSPNFSQHVMAKVLELDLLRPHVVRIRENYARKRDAMLEAADRWLSPIPGLRWTNPTGGLYVWLQLPQEIDAGPDGQLFDAAIAEGMFYVPGQYSFPVEGEPIQRNTMRLSFGVQSCEKIAEGIEALSHALLTII